MAEEEFLTEGMDEEKVSKYNAAFLINQSLEFLWRGVFTSIDNNDLWKWNRKLDAIWIILARDIEEGSEQEKKYNDIELEIGKTGSLVYKKVGFSILSSEDLKKMSLQYQLLKKKSLFLGRLQNKQGKGTAYVQSLEDYMD
jgi:hypothetical protein